MKTTQFYALALFATIATAQLSFTQQTAEPTTSWSDIAETLYAYVPESWRSKVKDTVGQLQDKATEGFYDKLAEKAKDYLTPEQQQNLKEKILHIAKQYMSGISQEKPGQTEDSTQDQE
jgi:hypothetical protein